MRRKNSSFGSFLTGVIFGGLIGGTLALLYAPIPGNKMRKQLSKRTDDFIDDFNHQYKDGKKIANAIIKDSKELYADGRKKAESIIKEAKKLVNT
jgi:gas vesicle protein